MAKIETPRPIRGTQDMLGRTPEAFQERFSDVVATFEDVRKSYGFRRVEIPVFESTAVFSRSLGESTDVVSKEMYTFTDRSGDSVTLRPEFTAGICRAYITDGWQQYAPLKVATHGPLFRYERPQKGRFRQFHQLDAEIIGASEPEADIELLLFANELLKKLNISHSVNLTLNTLGDSVSRQAWRSALILYFENHRDQLSEESIDRLTRNPMRILDSKDQRDILVTLNAPTIDNYLTDEAGIFFEKVKSGLDAAGVNYVRNSHLVRGLDYYRHTAFEFITDQLGAQGTVLGGGRYDGLIENMGGKPTAAVGWAAGIERLALLSKRRIYPEQIIGLIPEKPDNMRVAVDIAAALRSAGMTVDLLYSGNPRKMPDKYKEREATSIIYVGQPDEPNVLATLNVKSYRKFGGKPLEDRIAKNLEKGLKVNSHLSFVREYRLSNGFRVDIAILKNP